MKNQKPKQELCANCGHEKYYHVFIGCIDKDENNEDCKCEKFKPQSPESRVETPHKKQNQDKI